MKSHLSDGNAQQARKRVSADALSRDREGRILIVKPNYKPGWDLPGGIAEPNAPPRSALRRELYDELGLQFTEYALICVEPWDDLPAFIFDAGTLSDDARSTL